MSNCKQLMDEVGKFFLTLMCIIFIPMMIGMGFLFHNEYKHATKIVSSERILVTASNFNPPKHVYVDLTEVATGRKYNEVYVSKHFNDWQALRLNKPFYVTRNIEKYVRVNKPNVVDIVHVREGLETILP